MIRRTRLIGVFCLIFLLAGCTVQSSATPASAAGPGDEQIVQDTLIAYLNALHNSRYEEAAGLYGGSYEVLQGYNPAIDPQDKPALLEAACTVNGFLCLKAKSIELADQPSQTEFVYTVQFANADGSLFILGPCCGADETSMPPVSDFTFTVTLQEDGTFSVMDLPPYTP